MDTTHSRHATKMPIDKTDVEYKIYVNNLPVELSEGAIKDVFSQYGKVTGIFHPYNVTWAYITYGSYREAEYAIRELNDKKPLYLKVALAKNRFSGKQEIHKNKSYTQKSEIFKNVDTSYNGLTVADTVETLPTTNIKPSTLKLNQALSTVQKHHMSKTNNIGFPLLEGYNIYKNEEPYMNTSRLWSRGLMSNVSDIRNKRVSLGRGYMGYEKEQDSQIEACMKKGLYKHLNNELDNLNKIKKCFVCSVKTMKHCEKCNTYYCSRSCQMKDWPQHQVECIPALVEEAIDYVSSLEIKDERSKYKNQTRKILDIKLQQPHTAIPLSMQAENLNSIKCASTSKNYSNIMNGSTHNNTNAHLIARYKNNVKNFQIKRMDQPTTNTNNKDTFQPNQLQTFDQTSRNIDQLKKNANKRMNSISHNSNILNNDSIHIDAYLSKIKFTHVEIIVPLDNYEYWIYKIEDTDARINLMTKLQDIAERSRNMQPIIGNIYGVQYETIWHRAMVMSLNPIKVHYIDFGNDEILEKDNLNLKNIRNMSKVPKFARKIRLTQPMNDRYKNLQYGDKISVKMISIDHDKTIIVEVQEQESENSFTYAIEKTLLSTDEETMKTSQENKISSNNDNMNKKDSAIQFSVLNALEDILAEKALSELDLVGLLQVGGSEQSNVYSATLCPHIFIDKLEEILNNLQVECMKIENEFAKYKPQVGDFVCGKTKDGWHRGYIPYNFMTSDDLRIMLIDEAKIMSVDKIVPCPVDFRDICSFGVTCELNQPTKQLEVGEMYKFTTIMKKQKQENLKINISIKQDAKDSKISEVISAVIKPWKPSVNFPVLTLSELKNGSKICLISYRNHYFMFGRSLEKEDIEYYHRIMQCVAQAARTAPYLSESHKIEKSEMVIAPFLDGNYYRALVTTVQNDKATVVYVDFGNISEVRIKELQVLPDNLKMERSCAAKIYLKNVSRNVPMSKDVDLYLRHLIAEEVSLTCTHDGAPLKNGINLTMSNGEIINEKINRMLEPNWKQEDYDDKTCYMLTDIQIASLGNVGDTVDALVLFAEEDEKECLILAPIDIDLVTHITEVMPLQIKEFCESTEYYIPRAQELCLALYEGAWYRAVCLIPEETKGLAHIFFIDYGNAEEVEHKNIRLMPKDFIEPAAMASICTIINLTPVNSDGNSSVQQMLKELKPLESIVTIKIVDCQESGDYKIELSDIRATLIKQNLVS